MGNKKLLIFRDLPKRLRKELIHLHKHPQPRVIQDKDIPKPKVVTLTTGEKVAYEGP